MSDQLDEIEARARAAQARADAATEGPWFNVVNDLVGGRTVGLVDLPCSKWPDGSIDIADLITFDRDATFIAAARSDVPDLAADVLALTAKLRAARREHDCAHWCQTDGPTGLHLYDKGEQCATLAALDGEGSSE